MPIRMKRRRTAPAAADRVVVVPTRLQKIQPNIDLEFVAASWIKSWKNKYASGTEVFTLWHPTDGSPLRLSYTADDKRAVASLYVEFRNCPIAGVRESVCHLATSVHYCDSFEWRFTAALGTLVARAIAMVDRFLLIEQTAFVVDAAQSMLGSMDAHHLERLNAVWQNADKRLPLSARQLQLHLRRLLRLAGGRYNEEQVDVAAAPRVLDRRKKRTKHGLRTAE